MIFSCNAWEDLCLSIYKSISKLPLLQSFCEYIRACAQPGWSPSSLYENGTLGLALFLISKFACGSVSTYMWKQLSVCRYLCAHICENTHPGTGSGHDEEKLGHAGIIMLPLVFSLCPICCEPSYVGPGRHLHLPLQIWAWLDWHPHNP